MATLLLKAFRNEQHSVIHFLWAKRTFRKCYSLWDAPSVWWQVYYGNCNTCLV